MQITDGGDDDEGRLKVELRRWIARAGYSDVKEQLVQA